ncbi:MAG: type I-E CRISPR-associated protein Cse1/CasA, partial [Acidobacteriota bacterium]|nr:type I-E CRISPR-associated protein Cse1/CasA [Acidobacteriota bacterium]
MEYNLLEEKWIPVLWKDGKSNRVGIIEALECAGGIRCIALSSPLDLFAGHRFMLTLLYWKADLAGGVEGVRESLLKDEKIPSAVLDGIRKEARCFDLFDDKSPFLQDPSARATKESEKKPAGSLFAELATGTNIAHFHHGDDESLRLCLPCATLGILRVVPWSQSGGSGLTPSIHNAPPIMALATGDNLAETLGLNLVPLGTNAGEAKWSGHFKPTDPTKQIAYLEALTWNPRRVFLTAPETGVCSCCGQTGVLTVGPGIVYLKNADTKANKINGKGSPFIWTDPSAFYRDDDYKTVKSAREDRAIDNRDLGTLAKSKSSVITKNEDHNRWWLIVPCTNPANNKT